MNRKLQLAALAATAVLAAAPAHAAVVFSQDFSSGLSTAEKVGGQFAVGAGKIGHQGGYANNSYSFYQLALDLTDVTNAVLALDAVVHSEWSYDGLNLAISLGEVFTPADVLAPTDSSMVYSLSGRARTLLGDRAISGDFAGPLTFDLGAFSGQKINLRFQFASDYAAGGTGVQLDNLKVTGVVPSAVPEPGTWALMIAGFGMMGAALRSRRSAPAPHPV